MVKRILVIMVVVVVAAFFYFEYASYDAGRAAANGDVFSNDPPASKVKTDAGSSEEKAAPAAGEQTVVYPTAAPQAASTPAPAQTTTPDQVAQPGATRTKGVAPAADTISPNPPNGMVFSGSGKYQLYRQGNITWRLDTETGKSCILFATDEEWKKERVLRSGCGHK